MVEMSLEEDKIILRPLAEDPSERLGQVMGKLKSEVIAKHAQKTILEDSRTSLTGKRQRR